MRNILFIFRGGLTLIIILSLMIISPQIIYADGKHFPEKAYKKAPNMPSQRAVIIYKNDNEKLIIESTINGEGGKFGWIIPLPTKPENFEIGSAGLIKTLSITTRPSVENEHSDNAKMLAQIAITITILAVLILVYCLTIQIFNIKNKLLLLLFLTLVAAIINIFFMPSLGALSRGAIIDYQTVAGVDIKDVRTIGSYELAVLEAKGADELNEWLDKTALPD